MLVLAIGRALGGGRGLNKIGGSGWKCTSDGKEGEVKSKVKASEEVEQRETEEVRLQTKWCRPVGAPCTLPPSSHQFRFCLWLMLLLCLNESELQATSESINPT